MGCLHGPQGLSGPRAMRGSQSYRRRLLPLGLRVAWSSSSPLCTRTAICVARDLTHERIVRRQRGRRLRDQGISAETHVARSVRRLLAARLSPSVSIKPKTNDQKNSKAKKGPRLLACLQNDRHRSRRDSQPGDSIWIQLSKSCPGEAVPEPSTLLLALLATLGLSFYRRRRRRAA